jgi:hypothetical protein
MKLLSKKIKNGIPYFKVPKTAAKSSRREVGNGAKRTAMVSTSPEAPIRQRVTFACRTHVHKVAQ